MRSVLALLIILWVAAPITVRAQYDEDRQNPTEYTQEDSHPLKLAKLVLAPVGFVIEWTVARPLHYLANDTFMAPVFGNEREPNPPPAPLAELPAQNYYPPAPPTAPEPLREGNLGPAPQSARPYAPKPPPPAPLPEGSQPVLH